MTEGKEGQEAAAGQKHPSELWRLWFPQPGLPKAPTLAFPSCVLGDCCWGWNAEHLLSDRACTLSLHCLSPLRVNFASLMSLSNQGQGGRLGAAVPGLLR